MKGSSSSAEMSSGSGIPVTNEWSRIEHWMSPLDHDSFPIGKLFDFYDPISEAEADMGVIQVALIAFIYVGFIISCGFISSLCKLWFQYAQFGETICDNRWNKKNPWLVCDTLEGVVPLKEEKRFVEQKFNHPHDTEKNITECASSEGAPAKAKVSKPITNYTKSTVEIKKLQSRTLS